ncbi:carbohydrate-binding family 9-like protein [soil metagenome]
MKTYVAQRTEVKPNVDGRLDKPFWSDVKWTDDFEDIEGDKKPKPRFRTRAKMAWDAQHLYIGAELEEPHLSATLTQHDSVIFHDNDFEVFIDPDGDNHLYVEFEMNALNTTWDLLLVKPYRNGGPAVDGFELHGIQTAVHLDGTLNDPSDTDKGWSLEIAIPWTAFKDVAGKDLPPKEGDQWRINFSRVEWKYDVQDGKYVKRPGPEDNWVWSPQGVVDMHRPEEWGVLQFGGQEKPLHGLSQRQRLMAFYRSMIEFRDTEHRWPTCLGELDIDREGLELESAGPYWVARFESWSIDHDSRLTERRG